MKKSSKKVWKEYRFADGYSIFVRGLSASEKKAAIKEHGALLAIIDTDMPW